MLAVEADPAGLLILEQAQTERLLLDAVQASGHCDVRFTTEAIALDRVEDDRVRVTVREGGIERVIEAAYVVGCDGASSFVREALGLPFEGITYSLQPILADVDMARADPRDRLAWLRYFIGRGGLRFTARLRAGMWRIIRLETGPPHGGEVTDAELRPCVDEVLGPGAVEVRWASRFRIHRQQRPDRSRQLHPMTHVSDKPVLELREHFHKVMAKSQNARLGRWENPWSSVHTGQCSRNGYRVS